MESTWNERVLSDKDKIKRKTAIRAGVLSSEEKQAATVLSKSLRQALEDFKAGNDNLDNIIKSVTANIQKEPLANIEYVECYGLPGLYKLDTNVVAPSLLAVAVRFGNTRLIDNIILE